MNILVCVGSSCHLNGSHAIIELIKEAIKTNHLEDKVTLKATFCLGKCGNAGVNVKFDSEVVTGINENNFKQVFKTYVLDKIK
jgi:NADH:ubiquinone oxidoreductase 24 kD subunit